MTLTILGIAQPQGSARAFVRGRRAIVTSDNPKLHAWRDVVRAEVSRQMLEQGGTCRDGSVILIITVALPRPKALAKKLEAPHVSRPDIDKLARGVLDALTGIVYTDDSRVDWLTISKRYVQPGEPAQIQIEVT